MKKALIAFCCIVLFMLSARSQHKHFGIFQRTILMENDSTKEMDPYVMSVNKDSTVCKIYFDTDSVYFSSSTIATLALNGAPHIKEDDATIEYTWMYATKYNKRLPTFIQLTFHKDTGRYIMMIVEFIVGMGDIYELIVCPESLINHIVPHTFKVEKNEASH